MEEREYINQELNEVIRRRIPVEKKSIPFLMDLLQISRESVYRRLRGEVSYTIKEAALLSSKLNISFDELFDCVNNEENAYINFNTARAVSPEDNYVEMMRSTIRVFDNISEDQYTKMYYVGNKVVNSLLVHYKMLSKLRYIRWIHQTHDLPLDSKFSEFVLPSKVEEVHKEYAETTNKINQMTIVFDSNAVQAIINTIKFYYRRNLITQAELIALKNELLAMIHRFGEIARTGKNAHNADTYLYLSDLNIESNVILFESGDNMSVHFLSSGKFPLISSNAKVYEEQKLWVNSLLKFSILVTCSNDILQTEFVTKQINMVETELDFLLTR